MITEQNKLNNQAIRIRIAFRKHREMLLKIRQEYKIKLEALKSKKK